MGITFNRKKRWLFLLVIVIIISLSSSTVLANQLITTNTITPSIVNLCGSYPTTTVITASGINSNFSADLQNVKATLSFSSNTGITITPTTAIMLGNISQSGTSTLNPQWSINCNNATVGTYQAYINYESSNGSTATTKDKVFSQVTINPALDITPPTISKNIFFNYSFNKPFSSSSVLLVVDTNENSVCRYSNSPSTQYDSMVYLFSSTGNKTHQEMLSGLQDGQYSYYIKCKDTKGNKNINDYQVLFKINLPLSVDIELSDQSPVGEGNIKVTLRTSENVLGVPTLEYTYDSITNSQSLKNIPLSGYGNIWQGYITISSDNNGKIGTFKFSAKDLEGETSTIINKGNIFFVDTESPRPLSLIRAEGDNNYAKLSWYYNEKEALFFNIYKAESEDVTYLDLYDFVNYEGNKINSYIDKNVDKGKRYYYRIAVVDEAENIGALSETVYTIIEENNEEILSSNSASTTNQGNENALESTQSQFIEVKNENDLEDNKNNVGEEQFKNEQKERAATQFDLINDLLDEIVDTQNNLKEEWSGKNGLPNFLELIKEQRLKVVEIKKEILPTTIKNYDGKAIKEKVDKSIQDIETVKKNIPTKIKDNGLKTLEFSAEKEYLEKIMTIVTNSKDAELTQKELAKLTKEAEKLQKNINFKTEIQEVEITTLSGITENALIILRTVIEAESNKKEGPQENIDPNKLLTIEIIPKKIIENFDNIIFKNNIKKSAEDEDNFYIELSEQDKTSFTYLIKDVKPNLEISNLKTVLIPKVEPNPVKKQEVKSESNLITGFSFVDLKSITTKISFSTYGLIIAVAFLIVTSVYYSGTNKKRKKKKGVNSSNMQNNYNNYFKNNDSENNKMKENQEIKKKIHHKLKSSYGKLKPIANSSIETLKSYTQSIKEKIKGNSEIGSDKNFSRALNFGGLNNMNKTIFSDLIKGNTNNKSKNMDDDFSYIKHGHKELKSLGLQPLEDTTTERLMHLAEINAHNLDYDQAARYYHLILANQETNSVGNTTSKDIKRRMHDVHKKLCILVKVNQLNLSEKSSDYLSMKYILNDVSKLYNELITVYRSSNYKKEDLNFLWNVKNLHDSFSNRFMEKTNVLNPKD